MKVEMFTDNKDLSGNLNSIYLYPNKETTLLIVKTNKIIFGNLTNPNNEILHSCSITFGDETIPYLITINKNTLSAATNPECYYSKVVVSEIKENPLYLKLVLNIQEEQLSHSLSNALSLYYVED